MPEAVPDPPPAHVALLDATGRLVGANAAWHRRAAERGGLPGPCAVGDEYLAAWAPDAPESVVAGVRSVLAGMRDSFAAEYACTGPEREAGARPTPRRFALHAAQAGDRIVVSHHELPAPPAEDERWRTVVHNLPGTTTLVFDRDLRCTAVEGSVPAHTGSRPEELVGRRPDEVLAYEPADEVAALCRAALAGEIRELEARTRHGRWLLTRFVPLPGAGGTAAGGMAIALDVTERREYETRLRHLADHDSLTGLLNRRAFELALNRHVAHGRRYGLDGAVLVLDLDQFKVVNDTLGHRAGDRLLVGIAQALRARLRDSDVLARLGGDEFAVLLPHADGEEARLVAEDLLRLVHEQTVVFGDVSARSVSTSIGVALLADRPGLGAEELLVNADLAMYDAKEAGRDRFAFFSSAAAGESRTKARISWLQRIESALEHGRFELYAQPIVSLADGRVTQYELLLRMRSDSGDVVPPAAFLPVAERHGLVGRIDRWVVEQAIALLRRSAAAGEGFGVEINLSGSSMGDPGLLDLLEAELGHSRHLAERLIIEVTETAAVGHIGEARAFAERLSAIGCRFALDDFGAGFGSFYYLKHLPFDLLKIDGEFVRRCSGDAVDQLVVQSVVHLARGLGKRTVAEHVEDHETAEVLRGHGVDFAQGFSLGRPVPLEEALGPLPAAA